ncbi:hypothetical protein KSP39_PZI007980 [Platanthera zijinensis]|uniref:CCHC-type domain-containing protein n=1 Tax=Platanthera zijinensis TaxID=2320716 RepID=A0AAP0BMX6_9ASPA
MINAQTARQVQHPTPAVERVPLQAAEPIRVEQVVVDPLIPRRATEKHLKHVMVFNPPVFLGTGTPSQAKDWLSRVKRVLIATETEEWQKTTIATILLDGDARLWWEGLELHHLGGRQLTDISMGEFLRLFLARYLPSAQRILMENEFQKLRQGDSSVDEYLHEFTRFGHYASSSMADEERKTNRFYEGLCDDLRLLLSGPMTRGFLTLVNTTRSLEKDLRNVQAKKDSSTKKKEFKVSTSSKSWYRKFYKKARTSSPASSFGASGATTGRTPGTCYNCGKSGHFARDFWSGHPKSEMKPGATYEEKGMAIESIASHYAPAQPRVYNLGQQEAIKQVDVVTGTV